MFGPDRSKLTRNAMIRTLRFRLIAASVLVCLAGTAAFAIPFDPVFLVLRIKGVCQIAPPNSSSFSPIKPGRAYPYGSTLSTRDAESEIVIALCDNHECRLTGNTTALFTDETQDRENRTVHLLAGKLEVDLDQKNQKFTNRVLVQTAGGLATGEKARFTVSFSQNNEVHESLFECNAGMLGVRGAQFNASVVKEGAAIKVTGPTDLSWLRVQTVRGDISYDLRNNNAEQIVYPTKPGAVIKINQLVTESTKAQHVVLWALKPDGTTDTNYTYKLLPQTINDVNVPPADATQKLRRQ
jgi:hypothetical protein